MSPVSPNQATSDEIIDSGPSRRWRSLACGCHPAWVTYPAGPRRRRGGGLTALLLAVLFLAVLGASVGIVAGLQVNKHRAAADQSDTGGDRSTPPPDSSSPAQTSGGPGCPPVSVRDAKVDSLVQVRYILTERSEAWICRDPAGGLWYQGHDRSGPLDSDTHGILLKDVQKRDDGVYVATNAKDGTRYLVYDDKLVIERSGYAYPPEPIISSAPG
jgi:hypothetical protein